MGAKSVFDKISQKLTIIIIDDFTENSRNDFRRSYTPYIYEAMDIIVDFNKSNYINSSGVTLLLAMSDRKNKNAKISLIGASSQIKETINSTELERFLNS